MTTLRLAVLSEILADINDTRKSQGIFSAVVRILKVIKGRLFSISKVVLIVRSLEDALPDVKLVEGLTIREATLDDLHLFESKDTPSEIMRYRRALKRGETCLIALQDNQLAGYAWFTPVIDLPVNQFYVLPLASDEVYIHSLKTFSDFRRRGIGSALASRRLQLIRERGYRRAFGLVEKNNVAALELNRKLGYQVISQVTRVKFFRLLYFRYHPKIPGEARHTIKWLGM